MSADFKKKKCYLIGMPLKHSLSPLIHGVIYRELGLEWEYELRETEKEKLQDFISEVKAFSLCPGFNVTIPYKTDIIEFVDEVDEGALKMGAVNTVVKSNCGLKGVNTDWLGFSDDLKQLFDYKGSSGGVLVMGAGGAARAVIYALNKAFKRKPLNTYVYDICSEKSEGLKEDFAEFNISPVRDASGLPEALEDSDLLVNATPVGMNKGRAVMDLSKAELKEDLIVYDVVYNRETELLGQARKMGLRYSGGAGMLAGQGARAFELWSGKKLPENVKVKMKSKVEEAAASARE